MKATSLKERKYHIQAISWTV